ncbi:late control protein, partial [Paraburkholderia sp. SIMBA_050]
TMTGRADFAAEKTVTLRGFKKEADGDFLVESVTNSYAGRSWETQVELNAGNKGKAKVGHGKKKGRKISLVVPAPPH